MVTGLTNGSAYRFQVSASNTEGTSPYSAPSAPVTPRAVPLPSAPSIGTPVAGNETVTVKWSRPASDGGSPIVGYVVRVFEGDREVGSEFANGDIDTLDVTGLTNGTGYSFDVAAAVQAGTGPASARSVVVTPTTPVVAPGAPASVTATAGIGLATVRWSAPAADGGAPITSYTVRTFAGTTVVRTQNLPATARSVVVVGLTNKTDYTFDVTAANRVGPGKASAPSRPP